MKKQLEKYKQQKKNHRIVKITEHMETNETQMSIASLNQISDLVDKYFIYRTKLPNKESNSRYIRSVLESRIMGYLSNNQLNRLLIDKGFLFVLDNINNYCFNISLADLKVLSRSTFIVNTLAKKSNSSFAKLVKLHGVKNVDDYKYTFKTIIKMNFKSTFLEKICTEQDVYTVIAREVGINPEEAREYIDAFNIPDFPDMPNDVLMRLLELFNIKVEECRTDDNY
ncbi:hypothetical protein [Mangrovibacterium lignilyticum]|uniref:hypothetical protein n=1 Tax=Mangrovibacterium lignilyticum TaxID=2668052 RepID=UPI0013CF8E67|nr:hypothetical protein [Mangrovibacterium lignilyticum]